MTNKLLGLSRFVSKPFGEWLRGSAEDLLSFTQMHDAQSLLPGGEREIRGVIGSSSNYAILSNRAPRTVGHGAAFAYIFTGTGAAFHISRQYSSMVRSDENLPMRATLRIDIRVQRRTSR